MSVSSSPSKLPTEQETSDSKPLLVWLGFGLCLKCFAFSLLMGMLLLSLLFTGLNIPLGVQPRSLGASLELIYSAAIVPLFALIGDILRSLSPWGYVAFAVFAIVLRVCPGS